MPKPHPVWVMAKERRLSYRPFRQNHCKIIIKMSSPFASVDGVVPFDAILGAAVLQDLFDEHESRFGPGRWKGMPDTVWKDPPLPLAKHITSEGRKFYCASFGLHDGVSSISGWKKRWDEQYDDIVDFGSRQPRLRYKEGYFKSYSMPLVLWATEEIVFYARGWTDEIRRLLSTHISKIGKKCSQGYGRVSKIVVEEVDEDWSVEWNGTVMRSVPVEHYAGVRISGTIRHYGYRAPYYMPENQTLCHVP